MPLPEPSPDRRQALCSWLTANGIRPNDVPLHGDLTIKDTAEGRVIRYEAFVLDEHGRRTLDERRQCAATEIRTAPLVVEPPEWWQPHVKPSREELLDVLARVQQLAERWRYTADRKEGPRQELLQCLGEHAVPPAP